MASEHVFPTGQEIKTPEAQAASSMAAAFDPVAIPAETALIRLRLEVPEDAHLEVEIEARSPGGRLVGRQRISFGSAPALPSIGSTGWSAARLREQLSAGARALPAWLVGLSLGLYLLVRLVGLPDFPIYFFTDEAIQTVQAADLLTHRLFSHKGEFLPTYFENGSQYNLSTSVYLQVLPYVLLGKSVWVTRGAAVLMTLLAAACVGLILDKVFKSRYPWLGVLFLSITPAWFLHSRTAFETALAASFYAGFLYLYLMYRQGSRPSLYGAVVLGALAFYSYTPMRVVVLVTGLLLFLSDLPYHLRDRKLLLFAFGLGLLLCLPFARFLINHPDATAWQMRLLGSYWLADISVGEKVATFSREYLRGLDPLYWYLPNNWDLIRHIMLDYGHLPRQALPLGLLGIFLALRRIRDPRYRVLLIAVLAAPSGAALVRLGITRALVMVIPMAILTALAAQEVIEWLIRRWKVPRAALSLGIFTLLAAANLWMLSDALQNGPRWYQDYSLTGMQYGAKEVFGEIDAYLNSHPDAQIMLSPSWANGTDVIARFFFKDPLPFVLGSPRGFFEEVRPLNSSTLLIMTPEEFESIPTSRFASVAVEQVLPYPDGRPGFYFVHLEYVENIQDVIATEERERRTPLETSILFDGQVMQFSYPRLDIGAPEALFDRNPHSMARSWAINPMVLTLDFDSPRFMQGLSLRIGGTATTLEVSAWPEDGSDPLIISRSLPESTMLREAEFLFPQAVRASRLVISVQNTNDPPDGFVHLWEISLK